MTDNFRADRLRHPDQAGQELELAIKATLAEIAFLLGLMHYAVNDFNYVDPDHEKTARIAEIMTNHIISVSVPIGAVIFLAHDNVPYGYLKCDGKPIPPEFTTLIDLIGANAPLIENVYVKLGAFPLDTGGSDTVTLTTANMPPHSHTFIAPATGATLVGEIPSIGVSSTFFGQTDVQGAGQPFTVQPKFITFFPVIKAL